MEKKTLSSSFKNVITKYPEIPKRIRYLCIRCLLVFFLAISYCILGGVLFKFIEGDQEAEYKCGTHYKIRYKVIEVEIYSHNWLICAMKYST